MIFLSFASILNRNEWFKCEYLHENYKFFSENMQQFAIFENSHMFDHKKFRADGDLLSGRL